MSGKREIRFSEKGSSKAHCHVKGEVFSNPFCLICVSLPQVGWAPCAPPVSQGRVMGILPWAPLGARVLWLTCLGSHANREAPPGCPHLSLACWYPRQDSRTNSGHNSIRGTILGIHSEMLPAASDCKCPWRALEGITLPIYGISLLY